MIDILLPIIIILALAYIFVDYKKMEKKRLQEESKKQAIELRKIERKENMKEDKIKSYYMKQLPKIYDRLSDKELMHIYDLLQCMHQNEVRDFFNDPNAEIKTETYSSAAYELRKITGNSEWKHYYYNQKFYSNIWDDPVAKWDMYYVYNLLCSRGVKNW